MNTTAVETWREIPGFPGYQASDAGNIRSLKRSKPRVLKLETDKDGYLRVQLYRENGAVHRGVHRLVALAFLGEPEIGNLCCHNDGNPSNNRADNLRWDTQQGNVADKYKHGTEQRGSRHPRARITEADAAKVKAQLGGARHRRGALMNAAIATGVPYSIVADISRGRTWGHA